MHIPSSMLQGQICPVTLAVGAASVAAAAKIYFQSNTKVDPIRWAGVTAVIFALQMLNFPVMNGTSGHLIGGVLAAVLLGIPAGILSVAAVLFVQAVFFADGGLNALGANVINMGVIGAGAGGLIINILKARKVPDSLAIAFAAFSTVLLAAFACSLQVALSGAIALGVMAQAMLSVHAFIAIGEAFLTVMFVRALSRILSTSGERKIFLRLALFSGAAVLLSPFASSSPDGLESVAMNLGLNTSQSGFMLNWFADYQVSLIADSGTSTILAGLAGVAMVWALTWILARQLVRNVTV